MNDLKLTPEQLNLIAEHVKMAKPHLIQIEDEVARVEYGEIDLKLYVRGGVIEKMVFFEAKTWLKEKSK